MKAGSVNGKILRKSGRNPQNVYKQRPEGIYFSEWDILTEKGKGE